MKKSQEEVKIALACMALLSMVPPDTCRRILKDLVISYVGAYGNSENEDWSDSTKEIRPQVEPHLEALSKIVMAL